MKDATGKVTCKFQSDYKVDGNKVTVSIEEYYSQLHYSLAEFNAYKNVINAAADFNKVTILLQKK